MAARGEMGAGDLAWHAGLGDWQPAATVLAGLGIVSTAPLPPSLPSTPAGPAPARPASQAELYEAFVGPDHAGYYLPRFQRFDAGGSATSWNWPAALITQWWMIYRGMYLWGFLLYPLLNTVAMVVVTTVAAQILGPARGMLGYLLTLLVSFVVTGLYGNKIFHGHVRGMIDRSGRLGLSEQGRREWLIRKGSSSFIVVLIVLLIIPAIIGILAAIAIPAYQDYTIRSQVTEGVVLSEPLRAAVAEYYKDKHSLPADNASAGLQNPAALQGRYVQRMELANGVIRIVYGGTAANTRIASGVLAYVPETSADAATIHWHCDTPETTLPNKYLPQACRK